MNKFLEIKLYSGPTYIFNTDLIVGIKSALDCVSFLKEETEPKEGVILIKIKELNHTEEFKISDIKSVAMIEESQLKFAIENIKSVDFKENRLF